jgi:hypothetical protein
MTLAPGNRSDQIADMLQRSEDNLNALNHWEVSFIESIRDQFDRNGYLSENQLDKLESIYCEKVP